MGGSVRLTVVFLFLCSEHVSPRISLARALVPSVGGPLHRPRALDLDACVVLKVKDRVVEAGDAG
jgi:hypothetical protein